MKLSEMFPSNLLKAQDVTDNGGEMELTIKEVRLQEFDDDDGSKKTKPVVFFANDKKMVLNVTNGNALAEMYGDESDAWIGKSVILHVMDVPFGGKNVPAIRIKNLNSRDSQVQAYWAKTRELGFTREDGLDHLKQFGNDFKAALDSLNG